MMQSLIKIDQEIERTLSIAEKRFPNHSFPEPKIKMDLTGKCAGMFCERKPPLLRFNLDLMLKNKEDFIYETVPHEVAHYVVSVIDPHSMPHGLTWQTIMRLFGIANPQTYHDYKTPIPVRRKRPYVYECPCKQHFFTKRKHSYARSGISYTCNACKGLCQYVGKKGE